MAQRKRTRARELALQQLYSVDLNRDAAERPRDFLETRTRDAAVLRFAEELIDGCLEHRDAIDDEISAVARNWKLERLAVIDRNVLRLGAYELKYREDIPPEVTLNEAIELAKRFSTEKSGRFVNGLLDQIRIRLEREPKPNTASPTDLDGDIDEALEELDDELLAE